MSTVYQNIADNTGSIKVWANINVSNITRSNNAVTINGLQAENWTPTASAFDAAPWYMDVEWPRGTLRLGSVQTKPSTGSGNITNDHYFSSGTTFSYVVNSGDTSTEINGRINTDGSWKAWLSDQWGSIFVGIPGISGPSTPTGSAINIKPTTAQISASVASAGTNCTFSGLLLEYGLTTGYGTSQSTGSSSNTFTLSGLKAGATYYWRLTATNGAGLTSQSTGSFKTEAVPGLIPILQALI